MRWPRPITCGCMQTVSTPPSTCSCIQSNSSRQISSTSLGGAPPFAVRVEVELEVDPVVELEAHRQLPERRLAPALEGLCLRDAVADPRVERPEVVGHEARVVDEAVLLDELERRGGEVGATATGSPAASRRSARRRRARAPCRPPPRRASAAEGRRARTSDAPARGRARGSTAVSCGNDSTVWPGTKKVARMPCRSSRSSTRGTPTRAPYSPRASIAGVVRS